MKTSGCFQNLRERMCPLLLPGPSSTRPLPCWVDSWQPRRMWNPPRPCSRQRRPAATSLSARPAPRVDRVATRFLRTPYDLIPRRRTEFRQISLQRHSSAGRPCRRPCRHLSQTRTRLQCRRSQPRNIRPRGNVPLGSPLEGSSGRCHS